MLKRQVSFWQMLLPALGLHALLLAYPLPSVERDLEAKLKPGKPIRVVKLPPSPPSLRSATAVKSVNNLRRGKNSSPLAKKPVLVKPVITLSSKKANTPLGTPNPTLSPTPASTPQPSPSPSPTPSPTPSSAHELQMEGATVGCSNSKTQDCFNVDQTNGRLFSSQIEAYFKGKGFQLDKQELDDEHGMSVYQLSKRGHPKDYLHVFWDEEGTTYLRYPRILNHQELVLMARQSPS